MVNQSFSGIGLLRLLITNMQRVCVACQYVTVLFHVDICLHYLKILTFKCLEWLIQYQHLFQRKDQDIISDLFHSIERTEFSRDLTKREDVYVENMLSDIRFNRPDDQVYPIALGYICNSLVIYIKHKKMK